MANLIAHRGKLDNKSIENNFDTIIKTLSKDYIDGIEIDIRMTQDNQLVVIHDNTINRVSDGIGFVNKMTLNELYQYNFGTKHQKHKISTLNDILSIKTNKIIILELKDCDKNYMDMVDLLYKQIKDSKLNIYICSFHKKIVDYIYKKYPILKVSVIIGYMLNIDDINKYDYNIVSYNQIDNLNNDKLTFAWTINEVKEYQKIVKQYPNIYIITDNPTLLYQSD